MRAVAEQGYTVPTPIQAQAIPLVLAGRDLLGAAQTGTGKTAGFTLPLLQRLAQNTVQGAAPAKHAVRALILTPTRELALQVHESVRTYGKHMKLRSAVIYGGVGFSPQAGELRRGVDIVVATPGRLLDHVQQRTIDLRSIEILVLDEADRMLDMGFIHDIRRIIALLPGERQNLMFSATFSDDIRKLSGSILRNPATVEVARRYAPIELISQAAYMVDKDRKRDLLVHLVKTGNWQQVLVFCKTKHGANRLAQQLEKDGIDSDAIHGNKSQPARTKALKRFKDNAVRVLVATDVAARGLDIEALPHVVNYDMPNVPEDYVHRTGRTGRAGISGEAVSLVSHEDRPLFSAIERLINRKIEQKSVAGFEPTRGAHSAPEADDRPRRQAQQRRDQQPRQNASRGQPRPGQQRPAPRPSTRNGERPQHARRSDQPGRPDQQRRPDGARAQRPQGSRPGARPQQGARPARPLDRLEEERLAQLREGQRLARSEQSQHQAAPHAETARTSTGFFGFLKRKAA